MFVPTALKFDFFYQMRFLSNLLSLSSNNRPPPSKRNNLSATTFLKELKPFLGELAIFPGHLVIMGDFNIHYDYDNKTNTEKYPV